jgi:hypothetical protein
MIRGVWQREAARVADSTQYEAVREHDPAGGCARRRLYRLSSLLWKYAPLEHRIAEHCVMVAAIDLRHTVQASVAQRVPAR